MTTSLFFRAAGKPCENLILFKADALPPFKLGYFNTHGWLAYYVDGVLFKKSFAATSGSLYPDNNCNAEMYCNDQFVELESLGALTRLEPGAAIQHAEVWEVLNGMESLPNHLQDLLTA